MNTYFIQQHTSNNTKSLPVSPRSSTHQQACHFPGTVGKTFTSDKAVYKDRSTYVLKNYEPANKYVVCT